MNSFYCNRIAALQAVTTVPLPAASQRVVYSILDKVLDRVL